MKLKEQEKKKENKIYLCVHIYYNDRLIFIGFQ